MFLYKLEFALSFQYDQANIDCFNEYALGATPLFHVTAGTSPIAIFGVFCVGSELRLIDCHHWSYEVRDCDHSDDVGVRCLAARPGPGVCLYLWECQALSFLITQQTIILYKRRFFLLNTS